VGTVVERRRKDGSIAYMAQIAIVRGSVKHRETKSFDRRPAATAWVAKREKELARPGALDKAARDKRQPTLAEAIDRYTAESLKRIGRTKAQVLASIKSYPIAAKACSDITSPDIVEFAQTLAARVQPQTIANYLSHLGAVFAIARPAWGYPLDAQAMADAHTVARRLGLTAKSTERDRRPTLEELDRLMSHFQEVRTRRPSTTPMDKVAAFAIFSTRRLEEIVRIEWSDLDVEGKRILVRDMKHPGQKIGNNAWCDLPEPALRIVQAMPRTEARIFPYSTDAVGAAFTRACQLLTIEDLHFHDLRHEGVSRLFEIGLNIPHVAAVSGHRSWQSLKRYTHLRQTGDKYAGWAWLDRITPLPKSANEQNRETR
jgi:integrase